MEIELIQMVESRGRIQKEAGRMAPLVPESPILQMAAAPAAPAIESTGLEKSAGDEDAQNRETDLPQLLNLSELKSILRRYYPEKERFQRKEGQVVLELLVNANGQVSEVTIVQSAGSGFDQAARRVAKLLRFTPALDGSSRVPVKLRQIIEFKLE